MLVCHFHDGVFSVCGVVLDLKESNVNLQLTIVSTTGYGDQINKENRYTHTRMHTHTHARILYFSTLNFIEFPVFI